MSSIPWIGFLCLVLALLALDLGVFRRRGQTVSAREALLATGCWVLLALAWNVSLGFMYEYHWLGVGVTLGMPQTGRHAAFAFFTSYLVEESLSVDNLFVMALLFRYFQVPDAYQHRVLFFGILGALVFRGVFIVAGLSLIQRFEWIVYVFGALLLYTAVRMLFASEDSYDPNRSLLLRLARRILPVTPDYHEDRFFVHQNDRWYATPLFLALLVIEASDVVFAVDSVPAVFGVTRDPFIAFTSNVFAILGLRSLYFALAAVMNSFRYMKVSLVFVLAFVGAKMLLSHWVSLDQSISLAVIVTLLAGGVIASLFAKDEKPASAVPPDAQPDSTSTQNAESLKDVDVKDAKEHASRDRVAHESSREKTR